MLKADGLQHTVLLLAITKPARLYVSDAIMTEYREVLARQKMNIRADLQQQMLQLIRSRSYSVKPARPLQVTTDADDNMFLECADAAPADYLVTGTNGTFQSSGKRPK